MNVLLISYAIDGQLPSNYINLLTCASKLNTKVDLLVVSATPVDTSNKLYQAEIIDKIYQVSDSRLNEFSPEVVVQVINEVEALSQSNYTHILVASDAFGKNILPRLAGVRALSQLSEVVAIHGADEYSYRAYAGNIIYRVKYTQVVKLMTVRTTVFDKYTDFTNKDCKFINVKLSDNARVVTRVLAKNKITSDSDLTRKNIIVTGGKSLESRENFEKYIVGLAHKLNAGVGASRAAVEEGFVSNDAQVGQTGVSVAPNLYLAVGISGAMQHIAGMKDSRFVIAINNDVNAPIFDYSDYGIVGDLFEIVPQLIEKF